jgi:hypothetical protein
VSQGKLSALLLFLNSITNETKVHRREVIKSMCFSAYPDVQPWQVREACCSSSSKDRWTEAYYYSYLSTLLHPTEGNEEARDDSALVKVRLQRMFCTHSFGISGPYNFFSIYRNGVSCQLAWKASVAISQSLWIQNDEKTFSV